MTGLAVLVISVSAPAGAQLDAQLGDAAARLGYGFYVGDEAVVDAATELLQRLPDRPEVQYYRALAALRSMQLQAPGAKSNKDFAARCIEHASAATEHTPLAAEAWILVAACSLAGAQRSPLKLFSQRRRDEALQRALDIEPENPRALWVAAWISGSQRALQGEQLDAEARAALVAAVDAFQRVSGDLQSPDWGQAEALACYGALLLTEGDVRGARDILEQALLTAPGYRVALDLLSRIASG